MHATVKKTGGLFRVVEKATGIPLCDSNNPERPIDCGGFTSQRLAQKVATAVNVINIRKKAEINGTPHR